MLILIFSSKFLLNLYKKNCSCLNKSAGETITFCLNSNWIDGVEWIKNPAMAAFLTERTLIKQTKNVKRNKN